MILISKLIITEALCMEFRLIRQSCPCCLAKKCKKALLRTLLLCTTRKAWEENSDRHNKIGDSVWIRWVEYWNTPEFQAKSEIQEKKIVLVKSMDSILLTLEVHFLIDNTQSVW